MAVLYALAAVQTKAGDEFSTIVDTFVTERCKDMPISMVKA
jgi:hypothetical protein